MGYSHQKRHCDVLVTWRRGVSGRGEAWSCQSSHWNQMFTALIEARPERGRLVDWPFVRRTHMLSCAFGVSPPGEFQCGGLEITCGTQQLAT
jgi:hypothetical protein